MIRVETIVDHGTKTYVDQDGLPGYASHNGVVWTKNLFNCLAVAVRSGPHVGMFHIAPRHHNHDQIMISLFQRIEEIGTGPTEIVVAGGNSGHGDLDTFNAVLQAAHGAGATLVDATVAAWVVFPGKTLSGYTGKMVGFIAATPAGYYQLGAMPPYEYF